MKSPFFWRSPPTTFPHRLRPGDAGGCADLHATSFAHPWSAEEFEALLTDSACVGDGMGEKGVVAAFVLSRRALDEAEILTVVVDPSLRGKGCGGRLLAAHLSRLAAIGVATLFLEVEEGNRPALALYRRFGFTMEGRRKNYYARADGGRGDALVMRRILS
jgi:[ribosomal protein S18]-alanine N-acetyltransferase